MAQDTLVVGAALTGHRFEAGEHSLDGLNMPWNTMALWKLEKLACTVWFLAGVCVAQSHVGTGLLDAC